MTAPSDVLPDASTSAGGWFAVWAVAAAIFMLVMSEMLPVGVLIPVARDLGVSEGMAGLMLTAPAILAAGAAIGVPLAAGRLDRKRLLCGLTALLVAANVACALAPNFAVLLGARFAVGLAIGGFWAFASGLAARLVGPDDVARATAVIFGGVATGYVFGVPAGAAAGDLAGWRSAFAVTAALSLAVLAALAALLPSLPAEAAVRLGAFPKLFRNRAVRAGLIVTGSIVIGHFAAYTFIGPILTRSGGVEPGVVGALLLLFGAAGVAGNFTAGALAARNVRRTLFAIMATLFVVAILTPTLGRTPLAAAALVAVWGFAYGGVSVSLQAFMRGASPAGGLEAANAAWASVFNAAIALGAFAGGLVVDGFGPASAMWVAAAAMVAAAATLRASRA